MATTKIRGAQVNNATLTTTHLTTNAGITDAQIANANTFLRANGLIVLSANQSANGHTWTNLAAPVGANDAARLADISAGIIANNGILSNTSGLFVNANTGLVVNASGLFVNASYIGTLTANNSTYAFGKSEAGLNVNSALSANNSSYAFGKAEGALNVNTALVANNSTYAFGKSEAGLNVNSAVSANNAGYLNGHAEGALSVNTAVTAGIANNSTYAFGKAEGDLNVNSALSSNNASYLGGIPPTSYLSPFSGTPGTGQVAMWSGATWYPATLSDAMLINHSLLSIVHPDTYPGTVHAGDLITGQNIDSSSSNNANHQYTWASNAAQGWSVSGDLVVANGYLAFSAYHLGVPDDTGEATGNGHVTFTWEDLGVPAGANVVSVELYGWNRKRVTTTGISALSVGFYLANSSSGTSDVLANTSLAGKIGGDSWTTGTDSVYYPESPSTTLNVATGYRVSNASVTLSLNIDASSTYNYPNATATFQIANLVLRVNYTTGTTGILWSRLGIGGNGQVLLSNGTAVSWGAPSVLGTINNANTANYIPANTGIVSNASGVFVNTGIFIMNEVPSGDYNSVNTVVQVAHVPVTGSLMLYLNGLLQDPAGNDYSVVESTRMVTFADANTPSSTDKVRCSYVRAS